MGAGVLQSGWWLGCRENFIIETVQNIGRMLEEEAHAGRVGVIAEFHSTVQEQRLDRAKSFALAEWHPHAVRHCRSKRVKSVGVNADSLCAVRAADGLPHRRTAAPSRSP
jgi:hypothetical protein